MKKVFLLLSVIIYISAYAGKKGPSLKLAITTNNVEAAKKAFDEGADANEEWSSAPAIYWAAYQSNCAMLQLLIDKGAIVDKTGILGLTALNCVVDGAKDPQVIIEENKLINEKILKNFTEEEARAKGWWYDIDPANYSTPLEKVKVLLNAGADPNFLLGNGTVKEWTPFLTAVKMEKLDIVQAMIDSKKVDLEFRFHQWSEGVVQFVNYINASSNQGTGFFNQHDWEKKNRQEWAVLPKFDTPLIFAVEKNNLKLVKILVEGGASLYNGKKTEKSVPEGTLMQYKSPLDIAVENNSLEIISYLQSKGAIKYQD